MKDKVIKLFKALHITRYGHERYKLENDDIKVTTWDEHPHSGNIDNVETHIATNDELIALYKELETELLELERYAKEREFKKSVLKKYDLA